MSAKKLTQEQENRRDVKNLIKFFKLKNWKVQYRHKDKEHSCCLNNRKHKSSYIFRWGGGKGNLKQEEQPKDYILHEFLHVVLHELAFMDKRKFKEYLMREEEVVKAICRLVFPKL